MPHACATERKNNRGAQCVAGKVPRGTRFFAGFSLVLPAVGCLARFLFGLFKAWPMRHALTSRELDFLARFAHCEIY